MGKYVYASWGGDAFTVDEKRNFYKWNDLCIFTEDLLLASYRDLPAYFIHGKDVRCSNFEGSDIIDYKLIAHKLAVLNGETDEEFAEKFRYIKNVVARILQEEIITQKTADKVCEYEEAEKRDDEYLARVKERREKSKIG